MKTYSLNKFGLALLYLRVITVWKDGDGSSFLLNWWNPLAWVLAVVQTTVVILVEGVPRTWESRSDLGFCLSDYWKEYKHDRVFITMNWRGKITLKGG